MEFGEVVTTNSRAFWDDYESYEEIQNLQDLTWNWHNAEGESSLKKCETFIVIEGSTIKEFVSETILKGIHPLATIEKHSVSLYLLSEKVAVCVVQEKDLHLFALITELLVPFIENATNVYSVQFQPSIFYKNLNGLDRNDMDCFIRGLNSKIETVKPLEEPNFLTGVSAGVASWRKFQDKSFSCYSVYMKTKDLNQKSSQYILEFLEEVAGVQCLNKQYKGKNIQESNLYT